ncbi:hypothetical protein [Alsobacter sp. R-9]
MIDRRHLVALLAFAPMAPAFAGELRPTGAVFSVWTPSGWVVNQQPPRVSAHAPDESLYVSAEQLLLPAEGLKKIDVNAILDRELDDFEIRLDELRARDGVPYRRLEGTGNDDGDSIVFRMRAISHPSQAMALVVLVWGEDDDMADPATSGIADQILASLKPL